MSSVTVGTSGRQGSTGLTGATGVIGPIGSPGPDGVAGSAGAVGATGEPGATGFAGRPGQRGNTMSVCDMLTLELFVYNDCQQFSYHCKSRTLIHAHMYMKRLRDNGYLSYMILQTSQKYSGSFTMVDYG